MLGGSPSRNVAALRSPDSALWSSSRMLKCEGAIVYGSGTFQQERNEKDG